MKILFLSHYFYPSIGGIETISELLANSFTDAGHDVHVITWSADSTGKEFNFTLIRKPSLPKLFREHAWAEIVFENNPCLRLSWPRLLFKHPSIVVLQTWLPNANSKSTLSNRIKYLHLKRTTKVIAISNAVRKDCWPSAFVIGNSYDTSNFKIIPGINRTKDFVFIGRLVSDKGVDLALNALHLLSNEKGKKKNKQYSLTIIGDGPDRDSLEELVIKLELESNVEFIGTLRGKELSDCLNQHRFILVPSVWKEPFGIVALEGMACGCLPIVSDGGGLPDAVGVAGLTFTRGDVNSLVNAIKQLINNPDFEQNIRSSADQHLAKHHSDKISNQYLEIIKEISHL